MATSDQSTARFDYDQREKIAAQNLLKEKAETLRNRGPPNKGFIYPGCFSNLLAGFVVAGAIGYAVFANYPEPPLSPILFQWQSMGINATPYLHKGNKIFYVDKSNENVTDESLTLLFLHGFPTSSFDMHMIFANLTRNFHRIVAPDFVGFGFSDKPRFYTYSIMDQAELVIGLAKQLNLKRVHLMSHDYGDTVAQELLARYKEKSLPFEIASVTMMNGGVFPSVHRPVFMQKVFRTPIIGTIASKFANYFLFSISFSKVFGPHTQPSRETLSDSWKLIRLQDGYRVWGHILSYIDERFANENRWVSVMRNCPVPLHFIYGAKDPVNPEPDFESTYRSLVVKPSLAVLPMIGHYPPLEAPEEVAHSYLHFLLAGNFLSQIK
ncbi:hypothetical protein TYRP_015739 [Tyrophagus putrescentiae]|nr:hypothetical protein TYRP_015739 [Tyrophagus putrescentiae]